jgi:4-amino-4-deoxy-L-arabinose transferase-like glycosyltransferase
VVLTYALGCAAFSWRRALIGALVLPGTYLWMFYGRQALQDQVLTAIELSGLLFLVAAAGAKRPSPWALGWGVCLGLGLLTKSTMILLSVAATLPWLVAHNRYHRLLVNRWLYLGVALGLALFGGWFWGASAVWGQGVAIQLFGKVLNLGQQPFHNVGPLFYLWNLPANTFPWTFFALGGAWVCWRENRRSYFLPLSYCLVFVALLQLFATKEPYYMVQVCPFVALLAGVAIESLWPLPGRRPSSALLWTTLVVGGLGALLVVAATVLAFVPKLGIGAYLPLAVILGLAWMACFAALRLRGRLRPWREVWTGCLVGGPWVTLVLAGLLTDIGDYSPTFKAFGRQRLPALVDSAPVTIVYELNGERVSEFIEQAFYTPNPTGYLTAQELMEAAPTRFFWLAPESRAILDRARFPYRPLAEPVLGWTIAASAEPNQAQAPTLAQTRRSSAHH